MPEEARFRRCVLKSVIDSELNYIHSMKRIIDDYERPLTEGSPAVISRNKVREENIYCYVYIAVLQSIKRVMKLKHYV